MIREGRGKPVEFFDPNSPLASRSDPGMVTVVIDAEPERLPSLRAAVHDTRAAGVLATLVARYVFITPRVIATITPGISAPGKTQIALDMVAALQVYVDGLTAGDPAKGKADEGPSMLAAVKDVENVTEAKFVDVVVARADLSGGDDDEGLVDALLAAIATAPVGDATALRAALTVAVTAAGSQAPSGGRIPDRGLLHSTAPGREGQPATDEEIEAGTFEVSATVDGDPWWIALDMSPTDIALEEGRA